MNNSCENSFNLIGQIQTDIITLKKNVEEAEKKNLDYEMDLFKKNKYNEYLNNVVKEYQVKMREAELKICELELKLKSELREKKKNNIRKKEEAKKNNYPMGLMDYDKLLIFCSQ